MNSTHRIFLIWLVYLVCVTFGGASLWYLGLPQLAVRYDHSYLTEGLLGLYALAELLSARAIWRLSTETVIADSLQRFLRKGRFGTARLVDDTLTLHSQAPAGMLEYRVPPSVIGDHLKLLVMRAYHDTGAAEQTGLLELTTNRLYERSMTGDFIAGRIVWIGILATILGVIMAFWPLIDGASLDMMKSNLGGFFGGIAVAFIPTAVSFCLKIVLDCNTQIVTTGINMLVNQIADISEEHFLPMGKTGSAHFIVQR